MFIFGMEIVLFSFINGLSLSSVCISDVNVEVTLQEFVSMPQSVRILDISGNVNVGAKRWTLKLLQENVQHGTSTRERRLWPGD